MEMEEYEGRDEIPLGEGVQMIRDRMKEEVEMLNTRLQIYLFDAFVRIVVARSLK